MTMIYLFQIPIDYEVLELQKHLQIILVFHPETNPKDVKVNKPR